MVGSLGMPLKVTPKRAKPSGDKTPLKDPAVCVLHILQDSFLASNHRENGDIPSGVYGVDIKGTIPRAQGYHHFPYERCYGGRWQRALLGRHGIQAGRNSEKIFLECQVCVLFLNKGRKVRYTFAFTVVLSNITQSIF